MGELVAIVALIMIFGPIFYSVKRRYDLKEKALTAGNQGDPADRKLLEAMAQERKLLVGRIENLESIVCSAEYELNLRIARLAEEHNRAALGPAAGDAGGAGGSPARLAGNVALGRTLPSGESASLRDKAEAVRSVHAAPAELQPGDMLGNRYRIERLLGRGGMGAVYLANDQVLGEHVALKVISSAWWHDQQGMIERFRLEAAAARKVSSPNVIRIHDIGEAQGGLLYLSMEYFPGKTLAELVGARGKLGNAELRDIIGQVCDGLSAAHQVGIIHRDLKPQNILVGERNAVRLIDFGLAKTTFMAGMTATGLMLGTPHYMSPEQVRGKEIDIRSDIYSLGALTYFAATGRPPFHGDNPIAVGFAHLSEEPVPPRQHNADLPDKLDAMILKALAKEPRERPQSAAAFREALS